MAWQKGESGNPTGAGAGRKKMTPEMREALDNYGPEGIESLINIARTADRDSDKINAITVLLDRGFGKPVQAIDAEVTDLRPIQFAAVLGKLGTTDELHPKAE